MDIKERIARAVLAVNDGAKTIEEAALHFGVSASSVLEGIEEYEEISEYPEVSYA